MTTTTLDIPVCCQHPTFGLALADDDINGRVHVTDVLADTSIANLYSALRAGRNVIRGTYVVAINDHPVFDQQDTTTLLHSLSEDNATSLSVTIAQEPKLKSSQLWHNLEELGLYNPSAYVPKPTYDAEEEHVPDISLDDVR